jgi:hypothetical protein
MRGSSGQRRPAVVYESLLELDRLWLADFNPTVAGIVAQPMWLHGRDEGATRRHVPDLLLLDQGGGVTMVDVKPAQFVSRPEVAEVFDWTARLCRSRGWEYEVWSGAPKLLLSNVQYLGGFRRRKLICEAATAKVIAVFRDGMSIADIDRVAAIQGSRAATLALLWSGHFETDLAVPLTSRAVLTMRRQ